MFTLSFPRIASPARALPGLVLLILLLTVMQPVSADATGCTSCTVWDDPCALFEAGNETAYNAAMDATFAPIAANMTPVADYRNLSWTQAFISLNRLMKERYAFTQWRNVDFDALNRTWEPAIADAEAHHDKAAYLRALRGYLFSIPDGHANMFSESGDYGAKDADIGGGFGLALVQLDSGDVTVSYVANGSAAEKAGIAAGDMVTAWNGKEIHDAINATPYIWATKKPSTLEGMRLQQKRMVTRAPVGTTATVTFTGGPTYESRSVNLTAYNDSYDSLIKSSFFVGKQINDIGAADPLNGITPQIANATVTSRTLPDGYMYIRILGESYDAYPAFKAAMQAAIANNSPGVVLDFRWNGGGEDNLAACMAGWYLDRPVFFEHATMYDPGTGRTVPLTTTWSKPQPVRYNGPVAMMVSPDAMSSGEAVPMMLTKTGRGAVVSWYGTDGAYGINGFQAIMPLDFDILFPAGASLDENYAILVDSNASLVGGVAPTVRVPLDRDTVARAMAGEDVQLAYATAWLEGQRGFNASAGSLVNATASQTQKAGMSPVFAVAGLGLFLIGEVFLRRK
ncbi:S41 family peptidase [Methanoregula sp. UBA64]|uniref:S41 family peptidase n=1 Tax=Methanoregula sp. UBA64 TaxID=1915554 RepID=UPI0025FCD4FB|nr:S41 family peptidase [Methanoregula sp. UBA64]